MSLHLDSPGSPTSSLTPRRCTIVVIDDHRDTVDMLRRLFSKRGHTVLTAFTCGQARGVVDESCAVATRIDVIVCDVGLPDGDGVALMCELKIRLGCPAVALTGSGSPDDVRRCFDAGIDRHLLKPVSMRQLQEVMKDLADC